MSYSIKEITKLIGADRKGEIDNNIQFLLTDSRSLCFPEETLFFAIKTHKGNGGAYIPYLIEKGVKNFVVETLPENICDDVNFLVVTDARKALQKLAKHHRAEYNIPIIGITGS